MEDKEEREGMVPAAFTACALAAAFIAAILAGAYALIVEGPWWK